MFIQTAALALFGLVMALLGLLVGIIGAFLLLFYKKGVQGTTKKTEDI